MRRALVAAVGSTLVLGACVDLLHDTDFAFTERLDASALEAAAPAPDAGEPIDFCAIPLEEGRRLAIRSCALLSACMSPFGRNAPGACLERALPAMACAGARGERARGPVLSFYQCLAAAKTCSDVERCVFPAGVPPQCGSAAEPFTQCGLAKDGQDAVRIDCPRSNTAAIGEACAAYGQDCAVDRDVSGHCTGHAGLHGCVQTGCDGTHLHLCADASAEGGRDDGFDCANFGDGLCVDAAAGPACVPESTIGCRPSADVACNAGVAIGCPSGRQEIVDCAGLFGSSCHSIDGGALDAGAAARARAWDVQRACEIAPDAGGCTEDTCSKTMLVACARGARIAIDCAALVGTSCAQISTGDGQRPACARPPSSAP
jgi:hypothetical protein